MQTTTNDPPAVTAATWAARKARAIAYLQEKPPKGQAWAQKKQGYDYQEEPDDDNNMQTRESR